MTDSQLGPQLLGNAQTGSPARPPEVSTPDRVAFEVVTASGRARQVEIRVRLELVEVWADGITCLGVVDRDKLRAWLAAQPRTGLAFDDVVFGVDTLVDARGRVAITLPEVMAWTLSPRAFDRLAALL